MHRLSLASVLVLLVLAVSIAPLVSAETLHIEVETYQTSLTVTVYNQTVEIPANATVSIPVSLPENWTVDDVAAIHFIATNISGEIELSAFDANGTAIGSGTIVPLSSGYHQTLPPSTSQIKLSVGGQVASAMITVLVESVQLQFNLTLNETSIALEQGGEAWAHGVIMQANGPRVLVWPDVVVGEDTSGNPILDVGVYAGTYNVGDTPGAEWSIINPKPTTGPGWTQPFSVHIKDNGAPTGKHGVIIKFYAGADNGGTPTDGQLVATVNITGDVSGEGAPATNSGSGWLYAGVAALVILGLGVLFLGGGKRGRRGEANPLILLVLIAAVAIGAGLIDVDAKINIDPKMLGIGVLALLFLVMTLRPDLAAKARKRLGI